MITIHPANKSFLLYHTHLAQLGEGYSVRLQNNISKKSVETPFEVSQYTNYRILTLSEDVAQVRGKCTLSVLDAAGEVVYQEIATVK